MRSRQLGPAHGTLSKCRNPKHLISTGPFMSAYILVLCAFYSCLTQSAAEEELITCAQNQQWLMAELKNVTLSVKYCTGLQDSVNPEDEGRRFVVSYFLSDDISIFEKPVGNSGFIGGKFLGKTRVPKPGSSVENPEFYSPVDFAIGATVEFFGRRFVLTGAAPHVLKYLESISSEIPSHTLDSLRRTLGEKIAENQPDEQNGEEPKPSPT